MQNLSIPPHTHTERERGKERETFALLHARTHTEREGHVQVCADVAPLRDNLDIFFPSGRLISKLYEAIIITAVLVSHPKSSSYLRKGMVVSNNKLKKYHGQALPTRNPGC